MLTLPRSTRPPGLRRRPTRRATALLALLAGLLGLSIAGATVASAHAALLSTSPAANAVVLVAPTQVTLHFSEHVTLETDAMRVFDPAGKRVDSGPTGHAGNDATTAQVRLAPGLVQGTYTVAWRAISADTHPVSGAFTFSFGRASSTANVKGEQATKGVPLVGDLYGASRTVQYGGYALLVGSVALVLLCWPRGARLRPVQRVMLIGWAALLLSTVAELLLRGPYEAATGLGSAFNLTVVHRTLGEHLGTLLVVRLLLLAAAGVLLSLLGGQSGIGLQPDRSTPGDPDDPDRTETSDGAGSGTADAARTELRLRITLGVAGAVIAVALACTWALADHASVGIQVGLAVPLDVVHILSMGLWLGGLVTVLVGLWIPVRRTAPGGAPELGGIGARQVQLFSTVAMCSVTALVSTGVYQAWRGPGSWGAFTSTTYGRLLLVKICVVLVILAAAWTSRRWTAALRAEPEPGPEPASGSDPDHPAESDDPDEPVDPARQAQLDRQYAVRSAVAARRVREASPARRRLLRSVLLEVGLAVVVLVVTTLLTNAPPGRSVSAQAQAISQEQQQLRAQPANLTLPFDTGGPGTNAKGKVNITVDPARVGSNVLHVFVYNSAGKPEDEPELDVSLSLAAKDLGPLPVKLDKVDVGHWAAIGLQLPIAGNWQVSVIVRSDAIDETTVTAPMRVGG